MRIADSALAKRRRRECGRWRVVPRAASVAGRCAAATREARRVAKRHVRQARRRRAVAGAQRQRRGIGKAARRSRTGVRAVQRRRSPTRSARRREATRPRSGKKRRSATRHKHAVGGRWRARSGRAAEAARRREAPMVAERRMPRERQRAVKRRFFEARARRRRRRRPRDLGGGRRGVAGEDAPHHDQRRSGSGGCQGIPPAAAVLRARKCGGGLGAAKPPCRAVQAHPRANAGGAGSTGTARHVAGVFTSTGRDGTVLEHSPKRQPPVFGGRGRNGGQLVDEKAHVVVRHAAKDVARVSLRRAVPRPTLPPKPAGTHGRRSR